MLSKNSLTALIFVTLTAIALPIPASARDGQAVPQPRNLGSAISPDPNGTADALVPGETLAPGEIDARIGWLIEIYITDARAALRGNRPNEAAEILMRAQSALTTLVRPPPSKAPAPPSSLTATLAHAATALSVGDRVGADRALAEAERRLHAASVDLDEVLQPQSGPPLD